MPSAILVGDYYYLVDDHGIGTCLDAATGKTVWRKRFGGDFTASPVAAEGRVYFTNEAGSTLVIRADSPTSTKSWPTMRSTSRCSPRRPFLRGRFFLRSASHLWCLGGNESAGESSTR